MPPSFPGSVCPSSLLLCLLAVCTLLQASGCLQSPPPSRAHFVWCFLLRRLFSVLFSRLVRAGFAFPSPTVFLIRVSSSGGILEFSSPFLVFCCSCGFAGFCLSYPPLFANLVRSTSASLFSSSWVSVPWACSSESLSTARWLLVSNFGVSPASGFAPSAATLFRPALLVAVASLCFFSVVGQLALLAAPLVCAFSWFAVSTAVRCLSAALPFSSLWSAGMCGWGLHPLWPRHIHRSPALLQVFSSPSCCHCWSSASPLALLCVLPVWLSGSWSVGYLIASDRRSRFRVLFVLLRLSLSLLFPDPALFPLGAVPCWLRCLFLVPSTLELHLVLFLCWAPVCIPQVPEGLASSSRSILLSWWGPALLFPVAPSQSVLPALSGALGGLPGSLPASWFRFIEFSWFPVVLAWSFRSLPCGPSSRPLFGPLAVPPFLASCLVG